MPVGIVAMLVALGAWSADRVAGTAVSLEPPKGFTVATQFPGFQKADAGASIMVTEIPGPVDQVRAGMTKEGLASKGMRLLDSAEVKVAGRPALLLHVSQSAGGTEFEKWMEVLGDPSRTVLLVATFPKELGETLREPLKRARLTASWAPDKPADPLEGLNYRVSETADLKVVKRMSNMLLIAKAGASLPLGPAEPLAVVGTSVTETRIADLESFAKDRLPQTASIEGATNIEGVAITVDGLPAYELVADARHKESGDPLRVYQLVVADRGGYFLVQGMVGASQADGILPQFRELGHSLRRVQ